MLIWFTSLFLRREDFMKVKIPTPAGRVSLFALAIVGAAQLMVWLVRSQKTRAREPSSIDHVGFYRCC